MRAPSHKRKIKKCINEKAATDEASRRLCPLFVNVIPWSQLGAVTHSPKNKFRATIARVEFALYSAESLLRVMKCSFSRRAEGAVNIRIKNAVANAISLMKIARKADISELRHARPPTGRHGRHRDLDDSRNQTIAATMAAISDQFELSQEEASSIVSEVLKSIVNEHRRAFRRFKKLEGADKAWIDEHQAKVVDKLALSPSRIERIAKKYRM